MIVSKSEKLLAMIMHISQIISIVLASSIIKAVFIQEDTLFIAPVFTGVLIPFIIWKLNRTSDFIDSNGKIIFNWGLTTFLISLVSIPLLLIQVGMYLLGLLYLGTFIFSLIGVYKSYQGIIWRYPFSYQFFKSV